jgi:hypothetical protein
MKTLESITKLEYDKLSDRVSTLEGGCVANQNDMSSVKESIKELCKGFSRMSEKMVRVETIMESMPKQVMNEINLNLYKKDGDFIVNRTLDGRFGKWAIGLLGLIAGGVVVNVATPIWDLITTIPK